ncbi:MAG: hypothetical protein HIU92_06830 [Proteobacteria bacterium]|nr:hypothetical protein [Pseudomonadota bacterium]
MKQAAFVPPPPTKPTDRSPICGHPEEVKAFNILGLQTQLMQVALTCGGEEKYDVFVRKFQPQLAAQRTILKSFFTRAYGSRRAQSSLDEYVTQLADAESDHNLASGDQFCHLSEPVLDQSTELSSDDDLTKFLAKVPVQQALDVETCGTPGAPSETVHAAAVRHYEKHYEKHYTKHYEKHYTKQHHSEKK